MKKPKFRYVPQQGNSDCVIASIAMVTGQDYDDVEWHFKDTDKKGVSVEDCIGYLMDKGITIISKSSEGFIDINRNNKLLLFPFADIHIVRAKVYANDRMNHAFVMLKNGKCYNPTQPNKFCNPLTHYYWIKQVIGCYYEK